MKLDYNDIKNRIKNTFVEVLQIDFIETEEMDTLEALMFVSQQFTQTTGVLHGGATIAFAETIAGVGSNALCKDGQYSVGMQISASHLSSAQLGDTVKAIGTLIHRGRTTHVWDVDVRSQKTGKLISSIRITNAIIQKPN